MSTARSTRDDSGLLDGAFAAVAEGVASGGLASAVLAVASSDQMLRLQAFGPVATDSIFAIASITKPIFAAGVMRLVERGRVLLNEPVAVHMPEFATNGKGGVCLWHLLTHTSGLDEAWWLQPSDPEAWTWRGALARACAAPLQFAPGSRYAYCNASFFVMAGLVQLLTGQNHARYLTDTVLDPLGMCDTTFEPPDSARVVPVLNPPWRDERGLAAWISLNNPSAGLWSTAADLVRFGQTLLRDGELDGYRLVTPAGLRSMTSLQTAGIPAVTGAGEFQSTYGLGFAKSGMNTESGPSGELRSPAGYGHGGATGTYLWLEPEFDLVFVLLTNRWGQDDTHRKRALNATIAAASADALSAD